MRSLIPEGTSYRMADSGGAQSSHEPASHRGGQEESGEFSTAQRPLRVAIFASQFHPHLGGVEELVRQQALELMRIGHQVMVITNRWPKDLAARETVDGIDVRRYVFRCPGSSARQTAAAMLLGPWALFQICRELRHFEADVLHVQCVSTNAVYAVRAKRRLKLPLVITLQGEFTMDQGRVFEREDVRNGTREVMRAADVVTGCSARTISDAETLCGGKLNHARVIFNGARLEDFAHAEPYRHHRPYVLALGRLVRQKGFDTLIQAMALAPGAPFDALIAGEGPARAELEAIVAAANLCDRVRFFGRCGRREVASLFAGARLFVLPSREDEGLPVVCAEALASGRPTIAADVGGVREIVADGRTGLIVPPENPAKLLSAMMMLMDDEALRRRMGEAARQTARRFAWELIVAEYTAAYSEARVRFMSRSELP